MLDVPVLQGGRIQLRETKESDIDDRLVFGRPLEFAYMCGGNREETVEFPERAEWVAWQENSSRRSDDAIEWIIEYQEKCIGAAGLHHISFTDNSAVFAIGIWVPQYYSRGIGTEACRLVLHYAFEELKLHRVELKVLDYNERAIKCYRKCGFQVDGVLRENALIEGAYHSDIVMSILEKEYWRLYGRKKF